MSRIEGIDPANADDRAKAVFAAQTEQYGGPLNPYPILARRPPILRAVRAMWAALSESALLDPALKALLNRRVASINRCEF